MCVLEKEIKAPKTWSRLRKFDGRVSFVGVFCAILCCSTDFVLVPTWILAATTYNNVEKVEDCIRRLELPCCFY